MDVEMMRILASKQTAKVFVHQSVMLLRVHFAGWPIKHWGVYFFCFSKEEAVTCGQRGVYIYVLEGEAATLKENMADLSSVYDILLVIDHRESVYQSVNLSQVYAYSFSWFY